MCGIAGCIPKNEDTTKKMAAALRHRGPDFSGFFSDAELSMAHTLLAIRANTAISMQPVLNGHSPFVLAFNGQLYNTREMQKRLGPAYQNVELDTALLYGLIEKYGWSFIDHIEGMYAIALYHKETRELRLYRDQTGQKCVYYYSKDGAFVFASEIRGILAHEVIDRTLDEAAVAHTSVIGYLPGEKTLFAHIKKVLPGECVTYANGNLSKTLLAHDSRNYYKGMELPEVLTDVVSEHLQSKYTISINLSGGLDSSLLLYEAHHLGKKVETYSTAFEDAPEGYNRDFELAKRLSFDYGLPFHPVSISKEAYLSNFIESYRTIEEPNYNISVPVYYQMAKTEGIHGDKLRVVMSGDGGDEVFGGYPHYRTARKIQGQLTYIPRPLFNLIKNHRNHTNINYADPVALWLQLRKLPSKESGGLHADAYSYLQGLMREEKSMHAKRGLVGDLMQVDRIVWLAGENFLRSDKLYMSQSMEMRCPLSYQPLREYLDQKLRKNDYINATQNKLALRRTYEGKLPAYITHRPDKTGWRAPVKEWYGPELRELFLSILAPHANNSALIDWKAVIKEVEASERWPGKHIHAYLSLAILASDFKIAL